MGEIEKSHTLENYVEGNHRFVCKECCRETLHNVISSYSEKGSQDCGGGNYFDWHKNNQIIQCRGCETISFRVTSSHSEDVDYDDDGSPYYNDSVTFYPARSEGLKAINVYLLPVNVQSIYQETVIAIENEQNILAGIGIRALLETICKELNAKGKDLSIKINSLHESSIVTKEGMDTLHKLRILGNKAAHEVKKHDNQEPTLALQIIEHMLDGTYIIPHKVSTVLK